MLIRRRLAALALLAAFMALPTGCGAVGAAIAKWLPAVITTIVEAAEVLDAVETTANAYIPADDKETRKKFATVMSKARLALSAASHAAKGAQEADKQNVDAAWAEFQKAYQDVLALLGPLGIVTVSQDGSMSAPSDGGPLTVPAPEALKFEK